MPKFLTVVLVAITLGLVASDDVWVKNTFTWRGNGVMITEPIPVHGSSFRVRCSSPNSGPLRIIVESVDGNAEKEILNRQRLDETTTKRYTPQMEQLRFRIIGDTRGWKVEIDQLMDSIQEWRYRRYVADRKTAPERKIGEWVNDGAQEFSFTIKQSPCRMQLRQEGNDYVTLTVRNNAGDTILQTTTMQKDEVLNGSIFETGEVHVTIYTKADCGWTLSAFTEKR